jgi:uncharacterized peroxidase-related enzyme
MARIAPVNVDSATGKAKDLLDAVKAKMGMVPNMMATLANAPAVLESYLAFSGAVGGSSLSPKTREAIAIAIAETNACNYCLSAHAVIGKGAGLSETDIASAREFNASDSKLDAILKLARAINDTRGFATDADLAAARTAGITDAQILEVVAVVSLNVFTNYLNHVADPKIDFPIIKSNARVGAHA